MNGGVDRIVKRAGFGAALAFALAVPLVAACDKGLLPSDCVCTEEFRSFAVTVIDGTGMPVDSMDIAVTRIRDGFAFSALQNQAYGPGTYVIMDDGATEILGPGGEAVRVVASKDGISVSGDYVFAADDCLCHVEKVSGPDTLVWGVGT